MLQKAATTTPLQTCLSVCLFCPLVLLLIYSIQKYHPIRQAVWTYQTFFTFSFFFFFLQSQSPRKCSSKQPNRFPCSCCSCYAATQFSSVPPSQKQPKGAPIYGSTHNAHPIPPLSLTHLSLPHPRARPDLVTSHNSTCLNPPSATPTSSSL